MTLADALSWLAATFITHGIAVEGLPRYSIGYVNLAAWATLALTSVPMALVGVKLAHLLDQRCLKLVFIIVMLYMGLKMIGGVRLAGPAALRMRDRPGVCCADGSYRPRSASTGFCREACRAG